MFELNKPNQYKILLVEETDFDPDTYGNRFYSIVFEGDAQSHLWKTKNKPEVNQSVYGHFELSKSGKAQIFKRDKEPESPALKFSGHGAKNDQQYLKDLSDAPFRVYTASVGYFDTQALVKGGTYYTEFVEYIKNITNDLLAMSDSIRGEKPKSLLDNSEPVEGDPKDIPFD